MPAWLAPAKLNLFLHVLGRRDDGYHNLQTVFQFIDYCDEMEFELCHDGQVRQARALEGITEDKDLSVLAALRLQQATGCRMGASISIRKKIPTGAGLGGGSSNAATALLALNHLWGLDLERHELIRVGLEIGADVPVFILGQNAWAEGIGEELKPLALETPWYVVIIPQVHVSTGEIFSELKLTSTPGPITIRDYLAGNAVNHLQETTCRIYPQVGQAIDWLSGYGEPLMTGTGAAVFIKAATRQQAREIAENCPARWRAIYAPGLPKHPHG